VLPRCKSLVVVVGTVMVLDLPLTGRDLFERRPDTPPTDDRLPADFLSVGGVSGQLHQTSVCASGSPLCLLHLKNDCFCSTCTEFECANRTSTAGRRRSREAE
jgi:hypothetical protein